MRVVGRLFTPTISHVNHSAENRLTKESQGSSIQSIPSDLGPVSQDWEVVDAEIVEEGYDLESQNSPEFDTHFVQSEDTAWSQYQGLTAIDQGSYFRHANRLDRYQQGADARYSDESLAKYKAQLLRG